MSGPLAAFERLSPIPSPRSRLANTVFKSGPLFISSKGLGWKSWKKRWFILTRTSLVFFKNDPSALPQKGSEVNLTLGGIDLNNSGRVVVREDKKLLTVLFPDGRDGRAFTLKAETSDDLYEWKSALEQALVQAPNAALVMGHNGIFRTDANDVAEGPFSQWKENRPVKSLVVGRPILLALEDIDGGPSFLEKALRFLETSGSNVEGILRLCANVEEVEHRIHEYEQGKNEFGPDEDAHVVGDCVKHVLRELPSSPVPASCCTSLLDAYKMEKVAQINAMRSAILDNLPEPNRRLLQRILKMMHTIALHSSGNRMTSSAVATCMAPLLLRPLLAGECEMDDDYDASADNSAQLLAAANAANCAAGIVSILLEEYENIFGDYTLQRCSISADSRIENSASDDSTVDEVPVGNQNGYHDAENEGGQDTDGDSERVLSGKLSESSDYAGSDLYDYKVSALGIDEYEPTGVNYTSAANAKPLLDSSKLRKSTTELNGQVKQTTKTSENSSNSNVIGTPVTPVDSYRCMGEILSSMDPGPPLLASAAESCAQQKPGSKTASSSPSVKRSSFWGRSLARKTLSMESVDSSGEEELSIQRLELTKNDLRHRIAKEARGNAILQASLERRKQALHERRMALEQDVQRLQEQLQAERDLRAALEVGLSMSSGQLPNSHGMDSKTRAELEEIALAEADVARLKQKVAELHHQLNQQRQYQFGPQPDAYDRRYLQQDFDSTLAFCNHERKQRHEEGFLSQALALGTHSRQPSRKQFKEQTSLSGSRSPDAFSNVPMDDMHGVYSTSVPSTLRLSQVIDFPRHPPAASSTLVELTTRLDFFKERRSQLMDQLHNLDLNYGGPSQDYMYRPASPSWS